MDSETKQTVLRMIPYGVYVITSEGKDGRVVASTINWLTQASFEPPLVVTAVKKDSLTHAVIKQAGVFAINFLGKGQEKTAFTFFKSLERDGQTIGGESFESGETGAPVFDGVPACLECKLIETVEKGDHSIFVGEVVNAILHRDFTGRADEVTLWLKDLGEKIYYGG